MTRRRTIDIQVVSSSLKWSPRIIINNIIVTIRTQDESELLLRQLDDEYFGAQDDSDASPEAASRAAAESYESEEPSSDEDAPAARCVDLSASLIHI